MVSYRSAICYSLSLRLNSQQKPSQCLLKTAVARVKNQNTSVSADILLDERSQRSFVTKQLASTLDLKPYSKELITISAFGSKNLMSHHLNAATFQLLDQCGEETYICPHSAIYCYTTVKLVKLHESQFITAPIPLCSQIGSSLRLREQTCYIYFSGSRFVLVQEYSLG